MERPVLGRELRNTGLTNLLNSRRRRKEEEEEKKMVFLLKQPSILHAGAKGESSIAPTHS
jgi:hypothetical protein